MMLCLITKNKKHDALNLSFTHISCFFTSISIKEEQKRYPTVRQAYLEKESVMLDLLPNKSIVRNELRIYLAFKEEKKIELWEKNVRDSSYKLIKNTRYAELLVR